MTLAAAVPIIEYTEDGVSLAFPVPFRFIRPEHVTAERRLADGDLQTLVYGADYSAVGGETDAGGAINLVSTVAGALLTIGRRTPRVQDTDYQTNDRFPAETHEAALDRAMAIAQEQDIAANGSTGQALRVPPNETVMELPPKPLRRGKFVAFDADDQPIGASGTGADLGLREDLAEATGAALIGYKYPGSQTVVRTLLEKLASDMPLSIVDFGALPGLPIDNGPIIQTAFDFCIANKVSLLVVPSGNFRCSTRAVYSSELPFAMVGVTPIAGRASLPAGAVEQGPQSRIEWTGPNGSGPLVFETDGTSVANALNGIEIEHMLIYRSVQETAATDGVGIAIRGAYGGSVRNVTISGFCTGLLTDDNPSNAGGNSVRCGKINFTDVKVLCASKYRMRLRGTCQCVGHHLCLLEEATTPYIADLAIEPGTNAGRSDGNTFFGGAFIGNDDPSKRPQFNLYMQDTIFNAFYGTAFERSSVAGVRVLQNNHGFTPNTHAAAFYGCFWDAHAGYAGDFQRARVFVEQPRCGAHAGAGAAFRFVGEPNETGGAPSIGGGIRGGIVEFGGSCAVQVVYADGVAIDGIEARDARGINAVAVRVEAGCTNTEIRDIRPLAGTGTFVDNGTNTFIRYRGQYSHTKRIDFDDTFYLQRDGGGNPLINFDTGDTLFYNRSTNEFVIYIGGQARFVASATTTRFADATFYAQLQGANPALNFDANDYLLFNRAANELQLYVGGVLSAKFTATATEIMVNGALKSVQVGAVDSGGAGYRMLRVTN